MKRYKLSNSDQKFVAHLISQRSIVSIEDSDNLDEVLDKYLNTYNRIIERLKEYNNKATDL